jgi:uncharacterized protein YfiM (DUF2279 family)
VRAPAWLAAGSLLWVAVNPAPARAQAERDPWLGRDKLLHFGATFGLAGAGYALGAVLADEPVVRLGLGAGLAMSAGLAKEMIDRRSATGVASMRDVAWDAIGTTTGLLVSWLIDRYLW